MSCHPSQTTRSQASSLSHRKSSETKISNLKSKETRKKSKSTWELLASGSKMWIRRNCSMLQWNSFKWQMATSSQQKQRVRTSNRKITSQIMFWPSWNNSLTWLTWCRALVTAQSLLPRRLSVFATGTMSSSRIMNGMERWWTGRKNLRSSLSMRACSQRKATK